MWSAQGSKKIQSFNFVTISSEHYFCSSGVYTFGTILKDKASKRVLWLIVSGVGNNCMLLRHECDFAVCIVILSPISTAWESKSSIKKKKKKRTAALFSVTAVLLFILQPDGTELFQFVDGYSSWDAYLTSMMTDGTWGDHVILHGAANCFETCIHVISSLSHHNDVMICPEYDDNGNNRLVLGHVHELHYVSLLPVWRIVWIDVYTLLS